MRRGRRRAAVASTVALSAALLGACGIPTGAPGADVGVRTATSTSGVGGAPGAVTPGEPPVSEATTPPVSSSGESVSEAPRVSGEAAADPVEASVSSLQGRWPGSAVRRGRHVVVVGSATAPLGHVLAAAEIAWRRCQTVWPEPLPTGVVVVPVDEGQARAAADDSQVVPPLVSAAGPDASAAAGSDDAGQASGAAATTVVVGRPPAARARVHLAPGAVADLTDEGLRVILTHECVHVGLAAAPRPQAPRWLVEGVADHVAYRSSSVDVAQILEPVVAAARRDGPPTALPASEDFVIGADTDVDRARLAYARSLSAARLLARERGDQALIALVTTGAPDGGRRLADYRALEAEVLPQWRAALRRGQP